MENFRIAVKAFIVDKGKLLIMRRRDDEVHYAGKWDIPGGRLELGEDPVEGLRRETKEETNLDIEILLPIGTRNFTRDDGQRITMIIFLCRPLSGDMVLSKEQHVEYKWVDATKKEEHPSWLVSTSENFLKYGLDRLVG
jgi:8-oxo-dGTP diphosphatase